MGLVYIFKFSPGIHGVVSTIPNGIKILTSAAHIVGSVATCHRYALLNKVLVVESDISQSHYFALRSCSPFGALLAPAQEGAGGQKALPWHESEF